MLPQLIHLSRADVEALAITPDETRKALAAAFVELGEGKLRYHPKSQVGLSATHIFQTLMAISHPASRAVVKWVGMGPEAAAANLPAVSALLCLNDLGTGHPVAIMDGEAVTLMRTAGLSALGAERLGPRSPQSIGFAGCGAQAEAHLFALTALYPDLRKVICYSRTEASAQRLLRRAKDMGLEAVLATSPQALCEGSDILVSTVPAVEGLRPMLDARWLRPDAVALMVDLGRSWLPESFAAFDHLTTDSLAQMPHPMGADGSPLREIAISEDLEGGITPNAGRSAFCFRGHPIGDLALAVLVEARARKGQSGRVLPR